MSLRYSPLITLMAAAVAGNAMAQTLPSADVDTVRSGIGEESLAPLPVKVQPKLAASSTVPVSDTAAVVAPAEAGPFVVKGVVATISATGFDRDAALEVAARKALPTVLTNVGLEADKAAKAVKSLGNAMRFVQSYKVVKETLIPTYTLTTDLTFNAPMVLKNFGGKMPVAAGVATGGAGGIIVKTSGTNVVPEAVEIDVPVAGNQPIKQWVVRIADRDPAAVDLVRVNLNKQAGTRATYRLLTSSGAELLVDSPLAAEDIRRYAGRSVDVMELEIPLPTTVVPAGSSAHPWQGQDEPGVPGAPRSPNAPSAPNSPEGQY